MVASSHPLSALTLSNCPGGNTFLILHVHLLGRPVLFSSFSKFCIIPWSWPAISSLRVHSQEVSRLHMLLWRATVGTREILPKAMGNLPLLAHNIPKGPGTILQGHWTVLKMTLLIISKLSFYQCSHCNKDWDNKVVPEAMWPFRWFTN